MKLSYLINKLNNHLHQEGTLPTHALFYGQGQYILQMHVHLHSSLWYDFLTKLLLELYDILRYGCNVTLSLFFFFERPIQKTSDKKKSDRVTLLQLGMTHFFNSTDCFLNGEVCFLPQQHSKSQNE